HVGRLGALARRLGETVPARRTMLHTRAFHGAHAHAAPRARRGLEVEVGPVARLRRTAPLDEAHDLTADHRRVLGRVAFIEPELRLCRLRASRTTCEHLDRPLAAEV